MSTSPLDNLAAQKAELLEKVTSLTTLDELREQASLHTPPSSMGEFLHEVLISLMLQLL